MTTFVYDSLAYDADIRAERAGKNITDHMLVPVGTEIQRPLLDPVKPPAPCGTPAAWARHYYHGEPIDEKCRVAMNAYNRESDHRRRRRIASPCLKGVRHRFWKPGLAGVKAPTCFNCGEKNPRFYATQAKVWGELAVDLDDFGR